MLISTLPTVTLTLTISTPLCSLTGQVCNGGLTSNRYTWGQVVFAHSEQKTVTKLGC